MVTATGGDAVARPSLLGPRNPSFGWEGRHFTFVQFLVMAVDVVSVVSCNIDDIVVHCSVTILRTSAHKKTCLRSVDLLVVQVHGQARLFVIAVDVVIVVSRLLSVFNQINGRARLLVIAVDVVIVVGCNAKTSSKFVILCLPSFSVSCFCLFLLSLSIGAMVVKSHLKCPRSSTVHCTHASINRMLNGVANVLSPSGVANALIRILIVWRVVIH